jgi:regulator of replication initiation timing
MDREFIDNDNRHHVFNKREVRDKIIETFFTAFDKIPETKEDFILIGKETMWYWNHLRRYKLPIKNHIRINMKQSMMVREVKSAVIYADKKAEKIKSNGEQLIKAREKIEELVKDNDYLRSELKKLTNYAGKSVFPKQTSLQGNSLQPALN